MKYLYFNDYMTQFSQLAIQFDYFKYNSKFQTFYFDLYRIKLQKLKISSTSV